MEYLRDQLSKGALKIALIFVILILIAIVASPFLTTIIVAGMLAMAFSPTKEKILKRGYSPATAQWVILVAVFVFGLLPIVICAVRGSQLATLYFKDPQFLAEIKTTQAKLIDYFNDIAPSVGIRSTDVNAYFHDYVDKYAGTVLSHLGGVVTKIPEIILIFVILLVSLYIFLDFEDAIRKAFDRSLRMTSENSDKLMKVLKSSSREVFFANITTGIIQAMIVTLGSVIFGVGDPFLVFFVTFITSFVPIIGAAPVAFVLGVYAFLQGDRSAFIGLLVVATISGSIDNILRPYLVGRGESRVPTLVGLLAVLGGVAVFGLEGLFIGPFIAALGFCALPILFDDVFKGLGDEQKILSPDEYQTPPNPENE